jgi:UDP-glucuronate 4-epimerase
MADDTILLTGCAGFIGSHVTEALLARGQRVIGLDDFSDAYDPAFKRANLRTAQSHPGFHLEEADIRDEGAVARIVREHRPRRALLLAARAGVRASLENPLLYVDVNVRGHQVLLNVLGREGIESIVWASSSSVYGMSLDVPFHEEQPTLSPASPYAATKIAGEALSHAFHRATDIPISCLRFFTVYGPRQRPDMAIRIFSERILDGQSIRMFGDGSSFRDYTFVEDTKRGILGALDNPRGFQIYNLGCGRPVELRRMIELVGQACGREPVIERLPDQPGDVEGTFADTTRAREHFGYEPSTPLEEGVPLFVEWLRELRAGESGAGR